MVDYAPPSTYQFPARPIMNPQQPYASHTRRRTSSSGVFPARPQYQPPSTLDRHPTTSTSSSTNLHRTPSSSSSSSSSYVATLRRQKATVWCEKSQPEDARLLAAQRAARSRAALEIIGSSASPAKGPSHGLGSGSSSTTSLRGHKLGKSSTMDIGTTSLVSRPPPRLSATEATGDSSDEEGEVVMKHRRSNSGRSSLNSNHRLYNGEIQRRTSSGSGSSGGKEKGVILEETSPEVRVASGYFERDKAALKRSGSVDEGEARTMTMSGLRLVVANPD